MARRRYGPAVEAAIMSIDPDRLINALRNEFAAREAARIKRGPTEADIKLARMFKARGMKYDKWALGETE